MFSLIARRSLLKFNFTSSKLIRPFSSAHLSSEEVQKRVLNVLTSFAKLSQSPLESSKLLTGKFTSDLGLDSLDVVEVLMAVEEEFGLEIPDEVADGMTGTGDVIKYLQEKLH